MGEVMEYEAIIGLEIHAEMETRSKMFCACPVVDVTQAAPNSAVCPVCAGMPGTLPVINRRAVAFAVRVALALNCQIYPTSLFARKNYFYPDLPKGYQISQYEQPLAGQGFLDISTEQGERRIRIRRVHLEEDTGKSTHLAPDAEPQQETAPAGQPAAGPEAEPPSPYSLIDLNRAGVPLLEIVTEPDFRTPQELSSFGRTLRSMLRYLGVNSGDLQKGVLRVEPNISIRPLGSEILGTRTEVKNLNSFRAVERAAAYEIDRQRRLLESGQPVIQETVGWDEIREVTVTQRVKEEEDDYRYFPEPDLPPLTITPEWLEAIRADLPELPQTKRRRFEKEYGLRAYDAAILVAEKGNADYFEAVLASGADPKTAAKWITGPLFGLLNQAGLDIAETRIPAQDFGHLLGMIERSEINKNTARKVLAEMFETGASPESIVESRGLRQVSDGTAIAGLVQAVLAEHPEAVQDYLAGKRAIANWLFGQVMQRARGKANPQMVRKELERELQQAGE